MSGSKKKKEEGIQFFRYGSAAATQQQGLNEKKRGKKPGSLILSIWRYCSSDTATRLDKQTREQDSCAIAALQQHYIKAWEGYIKVLAQQLDD